jgi:hypothetical protein
MAGIDWMHVISVATPALSVIAICIVAFAM